MFPPLAVADCHIITKAFERGANFSATEESVFAMMTPLLTASRAQAKSFIKMATATETVFPENDILVPEVNASQIIPTIGEGDSPTTPSRTKDSQKEQTAADWAKKKLSECIPCEFRIEVAGDMFKKIWEDIKNQGLYYLQYFTSLLKQLIDLMKFWDTDKYAINLCNLWKFFTEFVCLPDFRRIISLLMAVLIQMAIELNSIFDILLMFVAPLILPFLMSLIAPLEQMLLMIIRPIDCIINAIIAQMGKLDYSAIFNVSVPTIKIGPRGLKKDQSFLKTTTFDNPTAQSVIDKSQSWGGELNLSPKQLFASDLAQEQADLNEAEKELAMVRQQGGNVEMEDLKVRTAYQKQLEEARAKVQQARNNIDQTAVQNSIAAVQKFQAQIREAFAWVLKWINYAKEKVTEYVNMIFDEIKRFMESFLGSSGNTILKLWDKLQIVQLLAMIVAIIDFIRKKKSCKEDKDVIATPGATLGSPLGSKDSKIWTDENGVTHIEEDPEVLAEAMNSIVASIGAGKTASPSIGLPLNRPERDLDDARQKVQSLIELTGDPVLDTTIARAVETLTNPIRIEFKCPLQTSVADAEQVNKWIAELSSR